MRAARNRLRPPRDWSRARDLSQVGSQNALHSAKDVHPKIAALRTSDL